MINLGFNKEEKQILNNLVTTLLPTGINDREATKIAKRIIKDAIKDAKREGVYGIGNLGDILIKKEGFLNKRLDAGLTEQDIKFFWNRNAIMPFIEKGYDNSIRLSVFKNLTKNENLSPDDAIKKVRKIYIHYGVPDKSHPNFQNEDADIFPEFSARYERWRNNTPPEKEYELAKKYTTYNAMIRDLIRKNEL